MIPLRHIRHTAAVLAGLACAWLGLPAAAPAAFAMIPHPDPGGSGSGAPAPAVIVGGMPGWQIALIVTVAALLAVTVAVLADRARAARRQAVATAA
ncbi:MAG: hypothetical protein ACRDN1_01710 [Trebonia sp.]